VTRGRYCSRIDLVKLVQSLKRVPDETIHQERNLWKSGDSGLASTTKNQIMDLLE
jgi:hypothetical protein